MTYWLDSAERIEFPSINDGIEVDVIILGGGIAGISTAFMLKQQGFKVALLEANRIVGDVTSGTTAKITVTSSLIYGNLLSNFGKDFALKFYNANVDAFNTIEDIIKEFKIDCDYKHSPLYLYSSDESSYSLIQKEYDSLNELGIGAELVEDIPNPYEGIGILHENQAEFHPKKYLNTLANFINGEGSFIFEKTRAFNVEDSSLNNVPLKKISTDKGDIFGNFVVVATNAPIYDPDSVCNFMYQNKSYIVGIYPERYNNTGMFVDINPFHSFRTTPTDKGEMLIVGGEHHSIGGIKNTWNCYKNLMGYVEETFDINEVEYFWSNQDNRTEDNVPIIGETSHKGVYIATGFGSWGMTTGTIAANVISQMILNESNKNRDPNNLDLNIGHYIDIFDPKRFKNKKSSKNINKYLEKLEDNGYDVDHRLNEEESKILKGYLMDLEYNEAKIVKIGNHSIAIYKDSDSNIYAVSSRSTHSGCELVWNTAEKSWECPEFGSRFRYDGKIIHGPAVYDLASYILKK